MMLTKDEIKKDVFLLFLFIMVAGILSISFFLLGFDNITGYAISGIEDYSVVSMDTISQSSALVNPTKGNIAVGSEFTVEVIGYPFLEGIDKENMQRQNNFYFQVLYDPTKLEFKQAEPVLNNFILDAKDYSGSLSLTGNGNHPLEDYYVFEPQIFLTLTFLPLEDSLENEGRTTNLEIGSFYSQNAFGELARSVSTITNFHNSDFTILEKGMDNFIQNYGNGIFWKAMTPEEQDKFLEVWWKMSPEEKAKYAVCTPDCSGKQCGGDGCGGFCGTLDGTCPDSQQCMKNICVCQPDCFGKVCGDDGCGGLCNNKKCSRLEMPSNMWKQWYTYLLVLLILIILIGSLIVAEKDKIKEKYHAWLLKKHQQRIMNESYKMNQGQFRKQSQQTQQIQQQPQQTQQIQQQAQQSKASSQLISFIMNQLNKGYNREQIEQSLLRVGWKKEMIDDAFRNIRI